LKHAIEVNLVHEIERKTFFNAKGEVSMRSKDLSNIEKPLIDLIFSPRYIERGIPTIGIDDHFITKLYSEKKPGPINKISLIISIINLNQ